MEIDFDQKSRDDYGALSSKKSARIHEMTGAELIELEAREVKTEMFAKLTKLCEKIQKKMDPMASRPNDKPKLFDF